MDGKANEAIIRFLAKLAAVPTACVRIVTGFASKELAHNGHAPRGGCGRVSELFSATLRGLCASTTKIVEIDGIDAGRVDRLIQRAILESHGPRTHTGSSAPGKS